MYEKRRSTTTLSICRLTTMLSIESGRTMDPITGSSSIPGVEHHRVSVNGTELHYISAGTAGSPVVLVHGFPETWWVFHKLIPLLSERHRVFAPDLRGFGDSATATTAHDSVTAAQDLSELITRLDVGPVHLTGQDISGPTTFRVAATRPDLVRSYAAIETGLPGFGVEKLADVAHGGAWHIGVLAAPGIPEMLLAGRERAFLAQYAIPSLCVTPDAFTDDDIDELARSYTRPDAFNGAAGLYRSMLHEGAEIRQLASRKLTMPVLAVGGRSGEFTPTTLRQVAEDVSALSLEGIGHYAAMEAPAPLAEGLLSFYEKLDDMG
ncbi:alpha/beta fold hydrolase [Streptomyces sp. NPDC059262]|uniref:alpha/beta fold hydrolase n=1 Tax=Streptomyces sp. NPDC059262 TaxID=3346797 RepID=UPI00368F6697